MIFESKLDERTEKQEFYLHVEWNLLAHIEAAEKGRMGERGYFLEKVTFHVEMTLNIRKTM